MSEKIIEWKLTRSSTCISPLFVLKIRSATFSRLNIFVLQNIELYRFCIIEIIGSVLDRDPDGIIVQARERLAILEKVRVKWLRNRVESQRRGETRLVGFGVWAACLEKGLVIGT